MKKPLIKIYGERNTGTHYLSELIRLNLEVEEVPGVVPKYIMALQKQLPGKELVRDLYFAMTYKHNLGWKHTTVKPLEIIAKYSIAKNNLSFVTITKNPYSWLLSLYKRPYHQYYADKPDFESFLSTSWKTVGRDSAPKILSSPVELWNMKNSSYLQLEDTFPVLNIKYEDILDVPKNIIELISNTFSYGRRLSHFQNYEKSTKEKGKDSSFYRDYYLNERWKDMLSPQSIAIINERLDNELMNYFRYEKLAYKGD